MNNENSPLVKQQLFYQQQRVLPVSIFFAHCLSSRSYSKDNCYGLNCFPLKIHTSKPEPLEPQNVTVFGHFTT